MTRIIEQIEALVRDRGPEWDAESRDYGERMAASGYFSAIEEAMSNAWGLLLYEIGSGWRDPRDKSSLEFIKAEMRDPEIAPFTLSIWDQVAIGRYRVDFLLCMKGCDGALHFTVVECDGHDFHERTKEQAEHDRRRDREMQAMGYSVLRFTGAEIWRSPTVAAWTALMQFMQVNHRFLKSEVAA